MSIGENIKQQRLSLGLTQDKLGEMLGVTGKAVSTWEKGTKIPRMPIIKRLSELFEIPKSQLIDDDSDKKLGSRESCRIITDEQTLTYGVKVHPTLCLEEHLGKSFTKFNRIT